MVVSEAPTGDAILVAMHRKVVAADSPYAQTVGYSRAVRVGDQIHVAGTAAVMPDGAPPPLGAYAQARRCLEIIVAALAELDARPEDVVRTRVYITSAGDWEEIGRAHGEVFGEVRPASAMLVISGLLDPRFLVEIEADAIVG
jgi:enamine deaminase RidA (YjgF/YER057c/UK114 family)